MDTQHNDSLILRTFNDDGTSQRIPRKKIKKRKKEEKDRNEKVLVLEKKKT
jgi:hypothetical protein